MPRFAKLAAVSVAAAAVLLLAGCGEQTNTAGNSASGQSDAVSVSLSEYKINPATITLVNGRPTAIQVTNTGTTTHTFTSPDLSINVTVAPGKTQTAMVTPSKAGTFEVHCTMPGHQQLGMKASIVVQ
ncbi:MAG: cupredoxin domain-containing protein [Candidatus Andersenbacteria bacterium]